MSELSPLQIVSIMFGMFAFIGGIVLLGVIIVRKIRNNPVFNLPPDMPFIHLHGELSKFTQGHSCGFLLPHETIEFPKKNRAIYSMITLDNGIDEHGVMKHPKKVQFVMPKNKLIFHSKGEESQHRTIIDALPKNANELPIRLRNDEIGKSFVDLTEGVNVMDTSLKAMMQTNEDLNKIIPKLNKLTLAEQWVKTIQKLHSAGLIEQTNKNTNSSDQKSSNSNEKKGF